MEGKDYVLIRTEVEAEHEHPHEGEAVHKDEPEHLHAEGEEDDHAIENTASHDHGKSEESGHAEGMGHDHDAPVGSMTFKRIEVKRGTTDGAHTAVTFLQDVPANAEVAVGGAYYLIAMMNTSSGHAVSYTHLDVYKRQLRWCTALWGHDAQW